MATRKKNADAPKQDSESVAYPKAGEESVTSEGSHRLISNGDGTARAVPIVDANGNYPARPEEG